MSSSSQPALVPPTSCAATEEDPCQIAGEKLKAKGRGKKTKAPRELPDFVGTEPKTAAERREWDRMSVKMASFHDYFRQTFQSVWEMADKLQEKGFTLVEYLKYAEDLEHHLHGHHSIEERYIFPVLAKKMPEFAEEHPAEHEGIHRGLERYVAYIRSARSNPKSYSGVEFRKVMSSFGPILMHHLDAEVLTLKGENLRRYYTLEEFKGLPFWNMM